MKKILLLMMVTSQMALAQKMSVKGELKDSTGLPLPAATVLLLNIADSSLVNFGLTDNDGRFEIKNVTKQPYLFKVSYVGYAPLTQEVRPADKNNIVDLGSIRLTPQVKQLGEVVVEATSAPVAIKKDTIEFNASSFRTKENAVVEDLLKKLPGIEVDNDGTIRAQGEEVKRVTVDGKNFFGNDPKLATRNLPADAIDKLQVFDKKSDQATFTGIDDGQKEKTINLALKEEKRKGAFGNLEGGYGSGNRYKLKANVNRFRKGEQLSFLGMGNNVNDQGFGIDDYMTFTGAAQQMMSGRGGAVRLEVNSNNQNGVPLNFGGRNSGIMSNYAGGVNFNKEFTKKTELTSSYFYSQLDHRLNQETDRINYRPDGDLRYHQQSDQHNTNENHRVNTTLEHKLDSMNSIKLNTSFVDNETDTNEKSAGENFGGDGVLQNRTDRITTAAGSTRTLNSNILWRHRFAKKGRTLTTNVQVGVSLADRDGTLHATTSYFGNQQQTTELNQVNAQETGNQSYSGTVTYTEPLGGKKYLEGNYTYRENLNDVRRDVFNINGGEQIFDPMLSNRYASDYQYHRGGINFRLNRSRYNVVIGTSIQQTSLQGKLKLSDTEISKSYQNILPVARLNIDFSNTKHLGVDYETSVQEPTIQQLQPVVDNSDPLNLNVGNPSLRPAYNHDWRLHFSTFNPMTFISFFMFADATFTTNAITTAQKFTPQHERISMPVNVNSSTRVTGDASLGFPIDKISSRINISGNTTYQNSASVVDEQKSNIIQQAVSGRARYDYHYKDYIDVGLSANINRQITRYAFDQQADQVYVNKTFAADVNASFLKNYQVSGNAEYLVYDNHATHFHQTIPFVNASLSRFVMKAKSGEVRFSINNILDRKLGISQTADINYFQRQTSNSLGRYFMLSFIYSLNRQLNPMGMRPKGGGGMIRIMH